MNCEYKKKLVITLEEKFDIIEKHECSDSNSKIIQNIDIYEFIMNIIMNIIK